MKAAVLLVILAAVLLAVWMTRSTAGEYEAFLETALRAEGQVVSKSESVFDQKNQRSEYYVEYRYRADDGNEYTTTEKVEYQDYWLSLQKGQRVGVYYNRDEPSESYLAEPLERRISLSKKFFGASR